MRKQLVAVVQSQIRGDDRSAGASVRLPVETIFRGHPHQRMREAAVFRCDDFDTVRPILIERICGAFELAPRHAAAVETYESGNSAHAKSASTISVFRQTGRGA